MKIALIHPSRSRPDQALITATEWIRKASHVHDITYTLSIDQSDPMLHEYIDMFPHQLVSDNHNLVEAANIGAKFASYGNPDILILISDDFECFQGWDVAVAEALQGKSGVLKTFDGIQKWIVTLPIMTIDYYHEQGHIYHPETRHMFCDTIQTHKAELQGKLIKRLDIVFNHKHYSTKGGQPKDAVNVKADSTWAQGEAVYLRECRNGFGITPRPDIFKISHAPHVNWLRKKLK